jgi:hypothetical protein
MANVLNMKQLVGTSYYFLRQYFGTDVPTTEYDEFIPENLREKQSIAREETGASLIEDVVEDIVGVQAVGSTVLENKKGEEIAQLTFTELPTLYSSMNTSSVGLEIVPGRMVEEKVTKTSVAAKSRPMTEAVGPSGQLIQNEQEGDEQEQEKDDDTEYEDYEELNKEEEKEEEIQQPIQQTEILIAKEQQLKQETEKELQEVIQETAANEVIQQQEQQYKLEQIKQMLAIASGNKDVAERKLKEAQENYNKSGFIGFGKSDTLKQIMDEKQKEKEKADQEYKTWYDRYLEATKEERERKMKEKEEAEKQKRYEKLDALLNQTQQEEREKEREKDAAAKIRAYIAKRKEAAEKQKDQKEAAEKQKRYEEVVAQLEEIERKEKEAATTDVKDLEAEKQSLLDTLEKEEGALDLGEISLVEDTEESNRQAVSEAAKKAVNTIHFLGLNSAEAILQAQKQLAEKERLTQEEQARKKAIETLFATVESGVGINRAQVEQKTKDILTQAKQQLVDKKREKDAFDLSNLDSIEKIEPLRQKNKSFKDSLKEIHDRIESSTDEYVKVLVDTQSSEDKEIKSSEIKTLAEEINHLYDSITLESDILDSTLNTQQEELKRKEAEKRKREEEEEQQKKLSEQERAAKMAKVQREIDRTYGALTGKNNFIKKTLDEINAIQMKIISSPKDVTSGDIDTLTKTLGTLEVGLTEVEGYNTSVQKVLEENNLSQNDEIKTKYPEIGNMNDLIQQGKEIVEMAKTTISDQQQKQKEKQEKIVNLNKNLGLFKKMIVKRTKEIEDNRGKLTSDDEEIKLDDAKLDDAREIIELLTTQYNTVEKKNTLLQEIIASGISDEEILTKNKEIQTLIENMNYRFEIAQGLYNELNTRFMTRQVEERGGLEDTASQSRLKEGKIGLEISGFLNQLSKFFIRTTELKKKIENKDYPIKDKKIELDKIKSYNDKLKGLIKSYISDESIKPEIKQSIRTEITKIQNSIDEIGLQIETSEALYKNRVQPPMIRQIEVAKKEGEEAPTEDTGLGKVTVTRLPGSFISRPKNLTGNDTRRQQRQAYLKEGEEGNEEQFTSPPVKSPVKPPVKLDIGETMTPKKRTNPKVIMKAWEGGKKTTKRRITNKKTKKRHK